MKNKLIAATVVVALAVSIVALYRTLNSQPSYASATPGQNPIENYVPVVKYNGGIYSLLPIQTTSDVTGATLSGTTGSFTSFTATNSTSTTLAATTATTSVLTATTGTITTLASTGITVSTLAASSTEVTTLKVGTNGSSVTKMLSGTCNLTGQGGVDTIVASGIATSSCAATGVALGDKVFISLNSTSSVPVVVQGASASTTDVIKVILYNATSSASQVTAVGTSTAWWAIKSN